MWELGWGDLWSSEVPIKCADAQQGSFSNVPFSMPSQGPESLASGQEVKAALSPRGKCLALEEDQDGGSVPAQRAVCRSLPEGLV